MKIVEGGNRRDLSRDEAISLFDYEIGTGNLRWKVSTKFCGQIAGCINGTKKKYRAVKIHSQKYVAHRIVWAWHFGKVPDEIDHVNGDGLDNRIENLRPVTRSQNCMNRANRSDNIAGMKGAKRRVLSNGRVVWTSAIWVDGKSKYLGYFPSPEMAHQAYVDAAYKHFGEHAREN